jgi:hypothetical protein
MIRNALSAASIAVFSLFFWATEALAAGGSDPTQVGKNLEDLVTPNAKSFWWIVLVVGALALAFSKKASTLVSFLIFMGVAGIVLYNPAGVASFMRGVADSVI